MATTGFIKGRILRLTISTDGSGTADKVIFHATSSTLSLDTNTGEITTKDTPEGTRAIIPKDIGGSISFSGLIRYDENGTTQSNVADLFQVWKTKVLIDYDFSTSVSGDFSVSGKGYITALTMNAAADDDGASFDGTLTLHEDITGAAIAP